jgi:multidrug efflux pump subunit AcrB
MELVALNNSLHATISSIVLFVSVGLFNLLPHCLVPRMNRAGLMRKYAARNNPHHPTTNATADTITSTLNNHEELACCGVVVRESELEQFAG